jgi:hypothetical protein
LPRTTKGERGLSDSAAEERLSRRHQWLRLRNVCPAEAAFIGSYRYGRQSTMLAELRGTRASTRRARRSSTDGSGMTNVTAELSCRSFNRSPRVAPLHGTGAADAAENRSAEPDGSADAATATCGDVQELERQSPYPL